VLVGDDADVVEPLAVALRQKDFDVYTAMSCREALKTAMVYGCDLLVSDLDLADGDGCDLLRAVFALRQVPAVAVTGRTDSETHQRARSAGFASVLTKPLTVDAVAEAIRCAFKERPVPESPAPHDSGGGQVGSG